MKKIKLTLYILLITLFFGCTIRTNPEAPVIIPSEMIKDKLSLTDIATEVKYLQIDNSRPIQQISNIKKSDTTLFIQTSKGVFTYNTKGKFLNEIGKKGKGPKEYTAAYDIEINRQKEYVYLLGSKTVYVYSFDGKFVNSFPTFNKMHFDKIIYKDSKLYFPVAFKIGDKHDYQWVITDETGHLLSAKTNPANDVQIRAALKINCCFEENNRLCYWNQLNDTIFYIDNKNGQLAYLFSNDKYRITESDIALAENIRNKSFWNLISVFATSKYLLFEYINILEKTRIYAVYDKNSKKRYLLNSTEFGKESDKYNAWDNGLCFMPGSKWSEKTESWFVDWIDAYQLKAHVASEAFKNSTPKYPEKKKELKQLANSLDENDNPILMLVKLKE